MYNLDFNLSIVSFLDGDIAAATILERIKYWTEYNSRNNHNYVEGYFWSYNTIEDWCKQLVFCSPSTFYKKISKLRRLGLIYTEKFNKKEGNQTLWYRINQELYNKITGQNNNIESYSNIYNSDNITIRQTLTTQNDSQSHLSPPGKIEIDFADLENSYRVTDNNNIKKRKVKIVKGELRQRGWYQPPELVDFDTWLPPDDLKKDIKQDYGLTEEQITKAHGEFVLYNKAKGTKFKFLGPIFLLWCKRFKAKLSTLMKKATRKIKEVVVVNYEKTVQHIEALRDDTIKTINHAILDVVGVDKYNQMQMPAFKIKDGCDKNSAILEFLSITPFWGDEVYKARAYRDEILQALQNLGYNCTKVLICDG